MSEHSTEQTVEIGESFERRRHKALRQVAPEVGRLAVGETIDSLEARRRHELKSLIVESMMGKIDSHYTFRLVNGQLLAADGEPIEELLVRGLRADIKKASQDPFYSFLPSRSRAELDNFRRAQAMALGQEDYNTLLETSVYNEEFDTSEENRDKLVEAAQKPYWGRTMVRLSHWDGEQLHIVTLSSDNQKNADSFNRSEQTSSVSLFNQAAYEEFGHEFKAKSANGMLAEPMEFDIQDSSWPSLAKRYVRRADSILTQRHGSEWHQGRSKEEALDLQKYVDSQVEAIDGLMQAEKRVAANHPDFENYQSAFTKEIYKCIALMELRLELGRSDEQIVDYEAAAASAGAIAEAEGKVYDACGLLISAKGTETPSTAKQTGLESLLRLENKKITCPSCDKKVVVAKKYLEKGELHCNECGYHVDICTGKSGFKEGAKKVARKVFGALDIIAAAFQRAGAEVRLNAWRSKQKVAQSGLEKKQLELVIAREEVKIEQLKQVA